MREIYNVLFLCTGNSARSIMAECLLNRLGKGRFNAYWDEFARPSAPRLDFVFTVCDNAAQEICPVWSGQPMTAHWGIPDPAAVEGSDTQKHPAFADALRMLDNRISIFVSLPLASLDKLSQKRLDAIGATADREIARLVET
jgi:protein-tyrosine-phosphatase